MSLGSRLALVALALVLVVAPGAEFHPVVRHLYAAGLSNLSAELMHPAVLVFMAIALVSVLPAAGFAVAVVRAARGAAHLRAVTNVSRPARMDEFGYRLLPSDAVVVFTAGLFRPTTFVSAGAERALGHAGLRAALLHEQAHERSQDVLWRLLLQAVGRGFAFLPWIRQVVEAETLRTECEADDYAIRCGARRCDLFEAVVAASAPPASPVAAGLSDANVELRLLRLVHPDTPLPGRPTMSFIALTAAVALPAVVGHVLAIATAVGASHLVA